MHACPGPLPAAGAPLPAGCTGCPVHAPAFAFAGAASPGGDSARAGLIASAWHEATGPADIHSIHCRTH